MPEDLINIEVAYALPERQLVIPLRVRKGTSLYEAVLQSGITSKVGGLDLDTTPMGVFGKIERHPKARLLEEGERAELYRPLIADPKEARRRRAARSSGPTSA